MRHGIGVLCLALSIGVGCGEETDSGDEASAGSSATEGEGGDDGGDDAESSDEAGDGGESSGAGESESGGADDGGGPPGPGASCDTNFVCSDPYPCELEGGPPPQGSCVDFGARICTDEAQCVPGCTSNNCECLFGMQRGSGQCFEDLFASPSCYTSSDCPAGWTCLASSALPTSGLCYRPIF